MELNGFKFPGYWYSCFPKYSWISPWCEDCAKEINDTVVKIEDVEDFYNALPEERKKFVVKF